MTTDAEQLQKVHFITEIGGKISPHFEIDPEKIYEVKSSSKDTHPLGLKTYRYVIAIAGPDRETAAHDFHDQVLAYPTKHGIFALYNTQAGAAQLLLNIKTPKINAPDGGTIRGEISPRNQVRIDKLKAQLHGHRMLIIRGAFETPEAFAIALTQAAQTRPAENAFDVGRFLLPNRPTVHDVLSAGANALEIGSSALETAGVFAKRTIPNLPVGTILLGTSHTLSGSGKVIRQIADSHHRFERFCAQR